MSLKDTFEKLVSYFDTDEVSDVEETVEEATVEPRPQKVQLDQTQKPKTPPRVPAYSQAHQTTVPPRRPKENTTQFSSSPNPIKQQNYRPETNSAQTTIALKYPRKYEDAQEIVDLLIVNECVLIDFQYMLDAQARRCLDFIDGASKVLYGKLQKVGSSMFLLTPSNVTVDIEELNHQHSGQDLSYDYDMKRR